MTEPSIHGDEIDHTDPSDWVTVWDAEHTFPFIEDEDANITGLGHQDKAAFAAAINAYDEIANGEPYPEDEQWTADLVAYTWAVLDADNERLWTRIDGVHVGPDTPGAVAITALWGQR